MAYYFEQEHVVIVTTLVPRNGMDPTPSRFWLGVGYEWLSREVRTAAGLRLLLSVAPPWSIRLMEGGRKGRHLMVAEALEILQPREIPRLEIPRGRGRRALPRPRFRGHIIEQMM